MEKIRKEVRLTIEQYASLAYKIIILIFLGVIAFSSQVEVKTGISDEKLNHALETQREEIIREFNNNARNEAYKIMDSVHILLGDTSNYDSLRANAFGL